MALRFRPARPGSRTGNVVATLGQTAVFWTVFLGLLPWAIQRLERSLGWTGFEFAGRVALGLTVLALASFLGLATGMVMAIAGRGTPLPTHAPRVLVVVGPYRYLRNPMAVTGLAQGAAVGLLYGSWSVLVYVALGMALWHWIVQPLEERDLQDRFGAAYDRYRCAVRCWIPRWPRGAETMAPANPERGSPAQTDR